MSSVNVKSKLVEIEYAEWQANWITDTMFEAHRGAYHDSGPRYIIFGNDGYAQEDGTVDPEQQREVELVRRGLDVLGVQEHGFGLSDDGYTWTVCMWDPRMRTGAAREALVERLNDLAWDAWRESRDSSKALTQKDEAFERLQREIAEGVLSKRESR
jgi:hypothetical protein